MVDGLARLQRAARASQGGEDVDASDASSSDVSESSSDEDGDDNSAATGPGGVAEQRVRQLEAQLRRERAKLAAAESHAEAQERKKDR